MTPVEYRTIEQQALGIAAESNPPLRVEVVVSHLDALAERVREWMGGDDTIANFFDAIYNEFGFGPANDYDDPGSNHLHQVLRTGKGSPIGLTLLLLSLSSRLGMRLEPIAFPGHFLVRVRDSDAADPIYADPLTGGRPLQRERLFQLAYEVMGDARSADHALEPVGPATVLVRLLLNLRRISRKRGDHIRGMLISDRLFELTTAPFHLADRGAHALALGAAHAAVADFDAYLLAHPTAHDHARVKRVRDRAHALLATTAGPN